MKRQPKKFTWNKKTRKNIFAWISVLVCVLTLFCMGVGEFVNAADKEIVIVIDPGHGGSQNGADYNGVKEKDITIKVSEALVEELNKYDGIKVYMTHDSSEDEMSIKQRADFAKKVKADYFFCIHFNASGNHNFYGAEAWITSYGRYYSEMYAFSEIVLKEFEDLGIYNRGIKTKLETDGTDYYGVLRRGAEYDIPAVIIEHCHMDNEADTQFMDEESDFKRFGQMDARAIAKFLHLKSSSTGEDYSAFEYTIPEEPADKIPNDETAPTCELSFVTADVDNRTVTFSITAKDEEYPVLYYGYSLDGGENISPLIIWEKGAEQMEFSLDYDDCAGKDLTVYVYNGFNIVKESEKIDIEAKWEQYKIDNHIEEKDETEVVSKYIIEPQTGGEMYLVIAGLSAALAFIVLIWTLMEINRSDEDTDKAGGSLKDKMPKKAKKSDEQANGKDKKKAGKKSKSLFKKDKGQDLNTTASDEVIELEDLDGANMGNDNSDN